MIVQTRVCDMPEPPLGASQRQQAQLDREHAGEAQAEAFGLDGRAYEVDLCAAHRRHFRDLFGGWAGEARRVAGGSNVKPRHAAQGPAPRRTQQDRARAVNLRAWGRENGWPGLSERGRIPAEVEQAAARAGVYLGEL